MADELEMYVPWCRACGRLNALLFDKVQAEKTACAHVTAFPEFGVAPEKREHIPMVRTFAFPMAGEALADPDRVERIRENEKASLAQRRKEFEERLRGLEPNVEKAAAGTAMLQAQADELKGRIEALKLQEQQAGV